VPYLNIQGSRIHYRLDGSADAPVLVFSNSLGTNLGMWEPQVPELGKSFRLLRYDTRGHGFSSVGERPTTIAQLGGDVTGLLDALGIERGCFCGLSMGGMIGIWLGIHAADRLRGLVLCNTGARIGTAEIWNARIAKVREGGMASVAELALERWYTPAFRKRAPEAVESTREMLLRTPAEGYIACCEAIRDEDLRVQTADIRVRTLVIAGSHDPATPPADGRFLAEAISGARYVELDSSHLSNIEAAEAFTGALLDFLNHPEAT
jgi:3-oxoadipate enol-lactonase